MKLLSFGEILFDVFEDSCLIGGAPFNFAAHCALQGAESYLLSAVGCGELGDDALQSVEKTGVNSCYTEKLKQYETGKCIVTLNETGIPSYNLLSGVAYDYIPCPDFPDDEHFDVFSFGTLALRSEYNLETVKKVINKKICDEVYSDLNIRPPYYSEKSVIFCLENATIVKISDEELPVVTKLALGSEKSVAETPEVLKHKFPNLKLIIITCGGDGSFVYDCVNSRFHRADAKKVNVVSTVGAGDSFGASFLSKYINGDSLQHSLEFASLISAYVCSKEGAIPEDMKEFISKLKINN